MAKRKYLDEIGEQIYDARPMQQEVVVSAKAPTIYWNGFNWVGFNNLGQRQIKGENFNPEGAHIITNAKKFEKARLAQAKKTDINRTHEFGEQIRDLMTNVVLSPDYMPAIKGVGLGLGKLGNAIGRTRTFNNLVNKGKQFINNSPRFKKMFDYLGDVAKSNIDPAFDSRNYYKDLTIRNNPYFGFDEVPPSDYNIAQNIRDGFSVRDNDYNYLNDRYNNYYGTTGNHIDFIRQEEEDAVRRTLEDNDIMNTGFLARDPTEYVNISRNAINQPDFNPSIISDYYNPYPYLNETPVNSLASNSNNVRNIHTNIDIAPIDDSYRNQILEKYIDSGGDRSAIADMLNQVPEYQQPRLLDRLDDIDNSFKAKRAAATASPPIFSVRRPSEFSPYIFYQQGENKVSGIANNGKYFIDNAAFVDNSSPYANPVDMLSKINSDLPIGSEIQLAIKDGSLSTNSLPLLLTSASRYIANPRYKGLKVKPINTMVEFNALGKDHRNGILYNRFGDKSAQIQRVKKAYNLLMKSYKNRFGEDLPFDVNSIGEKYPGFILEKLRKGGKISLKSVC